MEQQREMPPKAEGVMKKGEAVEKTSEPAAQAPVVAKKLARYAPLSADVIGNGESAVLFFHASWCPACKADDGALPGWYEAMGGDLLSTYKVDYDTSDELKQTYGVTKQHTYVKVDGQGKLVAKLAGGSDDAVMEFLKR
jgi:thioredoxin 1